MSVSSRKQENSNTQFDLALLVVLLEILELQQLRGDCWEFLKRVHADSRMWRLKQRAMDAHVRNANESFSDDDVR